MLIRTRIVSLLALFAALVVAVHAQEPRRPAPVAPRTPDTLPPAEVEPGDQLKPRAPDEAPPAFSTFNLDKKTPEADLLPVAPKAKKLSPVYLGEDLTRVPELTFEATPANALTTSEWMKRTAHTLAKADHLNGRKRDGFVRALIRERNDLSGLPFLFGNDCRKGGGERHEAFRKASLGLRGLSFDMDALRLRLLERDSRREPDALPPGALRDSRLPSELSPIAFTNETRATDHAGEAKVAAIRQIVETATVKVRLEAIKQLGGISRPEATKELARLAVFSPEQEVRQAALEALSVRRERDYTDFLIASLRYPWPTVAQRAAEAIVKLERKDLLPELVDLLDEPDPRAPQTETHEHTKVSFTRELVRVNHNTSCLLCHAPVDTEKTRPDFLTGEIPLPSEELPSPSEYGQKGHGLLVRIDVTYLRQDFAVLQSVKDADPWPEMQRFDFLVRKRTLNDTEADDLRTRLNKKELGELSPYHRAAVRALREMTGRDLEAKAEPWRTLLKLPAKKER